MVAFGDIYRTLEPLSSTRHASWGLKTDTGRFAFAASLEQVPILVGEFAKAALHYPIVFTGTGRAPFVACGLPGTGNLFVGADGAYDPDVYIPAFLRRYPFALAETAEGGEALAVCVDVGSDLVSATPDLPFFKNGAATPVTREALDLLAGFEQERRETDAFVELLKALRLFQPKAASGPTADGGSAAIANYHGLDESRLAPVILDAVGEVNARKPIAAAYAQLLSENNWGRLINRIRR